MEEQKCTGNHEQHICKLAEEEKFEEIWVEGEISNFRIPVSRKNKFGHADWLSLHGRIAILKDKYNESMA